MSRIPLAFMSYVNDDDKYANGKITKFREHLSRAVKAHRGKPFEIFQDKDDIKWGQQWQERINDALDATLFLIPIITPSFFNSAACREELERFLKREKGLGRNDLILPVYYIECPVLSDKAKQEHDKLAQIIAARQYADWRELCDYSFTTRKVRKALAKLAQQIIEALERSEAESARAEAVRKADAAKEIPLPQEAKKDCKEYSSSINTFQSSGGEQSIAQGSNAIGTQINYRVPAEIIAQLLQEKQQKELQLALSVKSRPSAVAVSAEGRYATITEAFKAATERILVHPDNPIGPQINNYGPQMPIELLRQRFKEKRRQPAPAVKPELPTLVVDKNGHGDYETISDALWEAEPGTRIIVRLGLYKESIEIDKSVKIEGDGKRKEIVIESDGTSAIVFNSENGRVANLTLTQPYDSTWPCVEIVHGILELEGCDISSQGTCVVIHDSATALLRANHIHDGKGTGIVFHGNNQVTLENNKIVDNIGHGVLISGGSKPILRCNRILKNSGVGIWVYEGGGGIFEDNDLRDNAEGAWFIDPDCEANVQRRGNKE